MQLLHDMDAEPFYYVLVARSDPSPRLGSSEMNYHRGKESILFPVKELEVSND